MSAHLIPISGRDLGRAGMEKLPSAIARAGKAAAWRFIEFFTANIRNRNTRAAYAEAVTQFFRVVRSARRGVSSSKSSRSSIAAYIEQHSFLPCRKIRLLAVAGLLCLTQRRK